MRNLTFNNCLFTAFFLLLFNAQAQENNSQTEQNPKFKLLLNEKRKMNLTLIANDYYKIEIFSGTSELAKKNIAVFKQEHKELDATIVFNTPNYKVWVGNFKTRIEAERNLFKLKKNYPNLLLIKPMKKS